MAQHLGERDERMSAFIDGDLEAAVAATCLDIRIDSGVLISLSWSPSSKVSASSTSFSVLVGARRPWETRKFLAVLTPIRYSQV